MIQKVTALVLAALGTILVFAACADAEGTASAPTANTAVGTAGTAREVSAVGSFFDTFALRLSEAVASDDAKALGLDSSTDIAHLIEQARETTTQAGTATALMSSATIASESGNVTVTATGEDTLKDACVDWVMTDDGANGLSGDLVTFTMAGAALIDAIGGDGANGLEDVGNLVEQANPNGGETEPVALGNGMFHMVMDTQTQTMSLIGEPAA